MNQRETQLLCAIKTTVRGGHTQCLSEEPSSRERRDTGFGTRFVFLLFPAGALPPTGEQREDNRCQWRAHCANALCVCLSGIPDHKILQDLLSLLFIEMKVGSQRSTVHFKVTRPAREEMRLASNSVQFQRFRCSSETPALFPLALDKPI